MNISGAPLSKALYARFAARLYAQKDDEDMKRLFTGFTALVLGAFLVFQTAEAARVGGGRSMGIQRSAPMQRQATPPAAAPHQAQPATPAQAQQPAAGNRWLGPLAGLAAGLGLGWLFSHGAFGGFGGVLLMALLAGAVVLLLARSLGRRPATQRPMQYAGGVSPAPAPLQRDAIQPGAASQPPFQARPSTPSTYQASVPAGFDTDAFLKQAKRNFLQLQEANDRADLQELRDVTTPEMYDTLKGDVAARGSRQQLTEVIGLDAELLEVATEGDAHWASVRFSGSVRESPSSAPEAFDEVWHLRKPVNGQTGWLLAGIQQPASA
jgi:predicted lipid-binding transport protein (Tim44 family)